MILLQKKRHLRTLLFSIVLAVSPALVGCKPVDRKETATGRSEPGDYDIRGVRTFARSPHATPDKRRRAERALCRLVNGISDPEPMLLHVELDDLGPAEFTGRLQFVFVDEQRDLLGIRVTETITEPNGVVTVIDEKYDAFVGQPEVPTPGPDSVLAHYRTGPQRRDSALWDRFLSGIRAEARRLEGRNYAERQSRIRQRRERTMPPLWISIPGPGKQVMVSVYDRSGNESEPLALEYWPIHEILSDL